MLSSRRTFTSYRFTVVIAALILFFQIVIPSKLHLLCCDMGTKASNLLTHMVDSFCSNTSLLLDGYGWLPSLHQALDI